MTSNDQTPAALAEQAAEAIGDLTHATISGGYRWPSDVDDVTRATARLTAGLQQTLRQAATWLRTEHDAGRVGHDTDPDPRRAVRVAIGEFGTAIGAAASLHDALAAAGRHTSRLTGIGGDPS